MRSTRSCSRAQRSRQRGYALIVAIVLAVLYFGLIELLLLDSSRELGEARRFRTRIVAETLAENAAELAALHMVDDPKPMVPVSDETSEGTMTGRLILTGAGEFELQGTGKTTGITESTANVVVRGNITGNRVWINYTNHY